MPLRFADPHKKQGMWYRGMVRYGRIRPSRFIARHISSRKDPWLYRATGGHVTTQFWSVPTAPLTTTGAKSGQPREVQLAYFHDGSDPILIASNYGGHKHPQDGADSAGRHTELDTDPVLAAPLTSAQCNHRVLDRHWRTPWTPMRS